MENDLQGAGMVGTARLTSERASRSEVVELFDPFDGDPPHTDGDGMVGLTPLCWISYEQARRARITRAVQVRLLEEYRLAVYEPLAEWVQRAKANAERVRAELEERWAVGKRGEMKQLTISRARAPGKDMGAKGPRGLESMAGSVKLDWWIDRDPGATFDASEPVQLPMVLDRLEDAITSALSQCVDVYIDGEDNPPVRVIFDLGGKEIEIDDGPINGTLDDIRAGQDE